MPLDTLDRTRLREALALAEQAIGLSDPNPRVGCVIARPDGQLLGRGFTQAAGQAHAEVMALREASSAGADLRGATAWVTLEPCAHHGRTPPCCDALIAAGLGRVVVAVGDPHPQVAGAGLARLRAAGIEVVMADADIAHAARELNIGFFHRQASGRPWVRLKVAASLDGITALADGRSQWITGAAARRDGQAWRRRAGAVLTGIGTVLADDPRLDVRDLATQRQPLRVVLDSELRTPAQARLLAPPGQVLLLAGPGASAAQMAAWAERGVEVLGLPVAQGGGVDLAAVLAALASRGINELHVEAGATLNAAWLAADLVDELLLYCAPTLLGPGRPMAALAPLADLSQASRWHFVDIALVGQDLRLRARRGAEPVDKFDTPTPA